MADSRFANGTSITVCSPSVRIVAPLNGRKKVIFSLNSPWRGPLAVK